MNAVEDRQEAKEFSKDVKARRGWWFSVMFLVLIVVLILFLTYVKIVDENPQWNTRLVVYTLL